MGLVYREAGARHVVEGLAEEEHKFLPQAQPVLAALVSELG